MRAVPRYLTALLLFCVFAFCLYRARTQSLTVDEAWVFQLYIIKPIGEMARSYDACNHVLHTLLMKLSRGLWGPGELTLRLPSLLAAALLLRAVYLLATQVFKGWWQPLAAGALVLHPLVLDHLVAARGYGLALAMLTWAIYCAVCYLTRGFATRWLWRAGVLAGLSIAANAVFVLPAAALGITLVLLSLRERQFWRVVESYGVPSVVTAFLILVIPLLPASREAFYFGETSLTASIQSLVETTLKVDRSPFSRIGWPILPAFSTFVVPAATIVLAAVFIMALRQWHRDVAAPFRSAPFLLAAGTLTFSVALLVALRLGAGVLYPLARTGLHLIPLFTLAVLLAGTQAARRPLRVAAATFGAMLVLIYATQLEPRYFFEWRYDAGTRSLLQRIADDRQHRHLEGEVRLAATRFLTPTTKYYRIRRRMFWIPEQPIVENLHQAKADYYLLVGDDKELIGRLGLELMHEDPVSGTALARPRT
jgi:4-amino-4-deoxy-L-arabinose transferase-like glycosyltransferase